MQKNYILDTNVLLHDPESIHSFQDNHVLIPIYVIEEVDGFKRQPTELGRNAREASRIIDNYRVQGNLAEGLVLKTGGTLQVLLPKDLTPDNLNGGHAAVDNKLLKLAVEVAERSPKIPVILVSKDTNLRIKADALGLKAEDYETGRVHLEELYRGAVELEVPPDAVREFHLGETIPLPEGNTYPNEYVWIKGDPDGSASALGRVSQDGKFVQALISGNHNVLGVRPRNKEQHFALDALLDPSIRLVTLMGKAGTGKTLLALAAGLKQVHEEGEYSRLLVSRPVFPMGRDLGYLPGELEEKLTPWMQPIHDNLEFLLSAARRKTTVQKLVNSDMISMEAITYIRGRSIPGQFMLVDEAQNLTPLEVKTIITRVGEGTKIVLTGDPQQIDNPYVDAGTNGFNHVVQRFRREPIAAHVELIKGERSRLAELASDLL